MVGMVLEERLDLGAVLLQLFLQGPQDFAETNRQLALGRRNRRRGLELFGLSKERQPFLGRFGAPIISTAGGWPMPSGWTAKRGKSSSRWIR
jgi:hypothetical protein